MGIGNGEMGMETICLVTLGWRRQVKLLIWDEENFMSYRTFYQIGNLMSHINILITETTHQCKKYCI
jgi:hypothetical protein